ncbi:leucine-rich repeat-containing protein 38-like, partial [Aplysia californica]|uniref:Leucine-rich repeat-containing protein 38-like n=1 Tax=Aplysia californica TaxID=6500 RepID=A0ABM1VV42_APLCA
PSVCACRDKTKLYCDDRNLTRLPVSFPTKTSVLDLSGNDIDSLEGDQFHSLGDLELLIIKHSHVKTIATGTFRGCFHLKRVELNSNQFERFSSKIFDSPNSITELNLMSNKLTELRKGDLDGLGHLRQLYLSNNMIRSLEEGVFQQLHRLETLDLR